MEGARSLLLAPSILSDYHRSSRRDDHNCGVNLGLARTHLRRQGGGHANNVGHRSINVCDILVNRIVTTLPGSQSLAHGRHKGRLGRLTLDASTMQQESHRSLKRNVYRGRIDFIFQLLYRSRHSDGDSLIDVVEAGGHRAVALDQLTNDTVQSGQKNRVHHSISKGLSNNITRYSCFYASCHPPLPRVHLGEGRSSSDSTRIRNRLDLNIRKLGEDRRSLIGHAGPILTLEVGQVLESSILTQLHNTLVDRQRLYTDLVSKLLLRQTILHSLKIQGQKLLNRPTNGISHLSLSFFITIVRDSHESFLTTA